MKYKIIAVFSIIIGIGLTIFSIYNFKNVNDKQKTYVETTATIVGYEDCELDDNQVGSRYIAEYKVNGNTYQIKENACSNISVSINKKVKIKYDPNNPNNAIFANDISHYILPLFGVIFMVTGIFIFVRKNS